MRLRLSIVRTRKETAFQRENSMVNGVIAYLNTDLDLVSAGDLTELAAVFEAAEAHVGHVTHGENGLWYAMFEAWSELNEPEYHISMMLSVVESLTPELRRM